MKLRAKLKSCLIHGLKACTSKKCYPIILGGFATIASACRYDVLCEEGVVETTCLGAAALLDFLHFLLVDLEENCVKLLRCFLIDLAPAR